MLVQNHGYASIGHLSETVGSQRFGTRFRGADGEPIPIDLAANARSYGVRVIDVEAGPDVTGRLAAAIATAKGSAGPTLIQVPSDPLKYGPDGEGWWDVPVAEVSDEATTQRAREEYLARRASQRPLLG